MAALGAINPPLLSFDELKNIFCHACETGNSGHPWPRQTIIFFKVDTLDLENAAELERNLISIDLTMGHWYRKDNEKFNERRHAEVFIIEYLKQIHVDRFRVEMVVSYSPCYGCSKRLLDFKNSNIYVEIHIKIANFYKHKSETALLPSLIKNGFELSIFDGVEEWVDFYTGLVATTIRDHSDTEHRYRNSYEELETRENRREEYKTLLVEFIVQNLHFLIRHEFELSFFRDEEECVAFYADNLATEIRNHYEKKHDYRNLNWEKATRENREKNDMELLEQFQHEARHGHVNLQR